MSVLPEIVRDHVIRANLPWRKAELTECGRELTDVATAITVDALKDRIKTIGKQRTAFTVCMTCAGVYINYQSWDVDPVGVIRREANRYGADAQRLLDELRAITALIEAHRDEFDGFLADLKQTTSLADARKAKRRAAYYGTHRTPPPA